MNYKIIQGTFHVAGFSPDGDSIRFQAKNDTHWDAFAWKKQANKNSKKKQLRFEAIDALETHYEESHQPRSFGIAALDVLLKMLGIDKVILNLSLTRIYSAADGTDGFIACQALDVYDRPVSLVFAKNASLRDGDEVTLDDLPMDACVNMKMAKMGLVYPTFYSTMEEGLLDVFTKLTKTCRDKQVGLWALDKTGYFTIWNTTTIADDIVILPKIFRRLTTFFQDSSDFSQLTDYLGKKKDKVKIRSTGQTTYLSKLLEIDGRNIRFAYKPEDLIFDPKG